MYLNIFTGAVVHKLIKHKSTIVSVGFTADGNIAITGKQIFSIKCFPFRKSNFSLFQASQDGFLAAWSTMTGIHLAAFHFNQILVKLLVAPTGGIDNLKKNFINMENLFLLARYAAILQNTCCVAMLSLYNISSNDASKLPQRHSQCNYIVLFFILKILFSSLFNFVLVFSDPSNNLLPIKPKPLLYAKDSTLLSKSRQNSRSDPTSGTILVSHHFFLFYALGRKK